MLINKVAEEFKKLWRKDFGINCGSDDCTYTATFYGNNNLDEVDYIDGSNCTDIIKKAIKETINDDGFHIHECMQIYLDCDSTDESKQKLQTFYPIEEKNVNKYIDKYNSTAKYWKISISMTDIEDSGGWQFLEFPRYDLTDKTIESLKKELNQGDDKMFEDLIARVRVYKAKGDKPYQHRPYELTLISDKTKVFQNINQDNDRNNISKANFIFHHLYENGVDEDKSDGSENDYNNIKEIEAIILSNRDLHIAHHNLQYEPKYRGRDGWEICGIDLTRVIMYKFTLTDNTIIRFDFSGMIDNEEGTQGIYFQNIIDKNAEKHEQYKQEKRTKKLIEEIKNEEEDNIIELSGSPVYSDPKNNFDKDSGLIPQGEFPYMVEFFSDLVLDEDTIYQGTFGLNSRYIKDAIRLIDKVEHRAEELAEKYADKGVKVTVNGLNDGCEKGMAVYVWIPYQ